MAGQALPQGPIPDLRSMEELLQAPTDGVGDAIVVLPILANQFELKIGLLNLVTAIAFHGFENDDPHSHIRRFTKITQTFILNNISVDVVKLLLFPFSLEGAARTWLEKEPPNSITTWNDLVSKFVNRFFPPSKTTNLQNEITRFQQRFGETFAEAWDRFKDLLNKSNGNFLTRNTQEALTIIENKSKQVEALLSLHRPVNSVQNGCETCGSSHAYYECQAVGGYTQEDVYATTGALPSNTKPNPREQVNSIMTRSGLTTAEPSIPPPMHPTPSLMDALTQIPKFTKVLKDLLKDKEKLEELANTPINVECFAILLNKVPEKLEYPGKVGPLKPTRMTLELANRSVTFPMGIAGDVIVKVEKFNFLADFVIVDFEADPRVPIILGRPFLRTARALVDLYEEKLTLRFENEKVVDKPTSGSTTFPSDSSPSSLLVKTSDSLLEEFADELALLDLFPSGNDDDNFDPAVDLREIEYLLNRDPSTVSSPTNDIDIIDPFLERFTVEPALVYSSPPGDDDDDLFDLKSNNDEWKKFLYGDSYNDTHSKNDETKDSKTKSLIDEANIVESNVLRPQLLTSDLTLSEDSSESSEIATLLSSPFRNEDKVFNPGIFILGETHIFNNESKDKDFKVNTSSEVFLILEERNFLSISSHQELLFHPSPCHSFDQPIDQQTDLIAPSFLL
ncbi:reverse transcriptase domain-containing protein [Tanacetum coccineum]